jgi:hypothetical protein
VEFRLVLVVVVQVESEVLQRLQGITLQVMVVRELQTQLQEHRLYTEAAVAVLPVLAVVRQVQLLVSEVLAVEVMEVMAARYQPMEQMVWAVVVVDRKQAQVQVVVQEP